jgi:hypothetical protein
MYRWKLRKSKVFSIRKIVDNKLDILEVKDHFRYGDSVSPMGICIHGNYIKKYSCYLEIAEFGSLDRKSMRS